MVDKNKDISKSFLSLKEMIFKIAVYAFVLPFAQAQSHSHSSLPGSVFKHVLPTSQWIDYSPDRPERAVILDDEGGAIVVSQTLSGFLLVQKIDRYGNNLWAEPGQGRRVALNTPERDAEYAPILLSDGAGGAFIAYASSEQKMNGTELWYNYDVYVQHIAGNFARTWGDWGVAVAADDSIITEYPDGLIRDGEGGCIVLYQGAGQGPYATMYMQRIDPNGNFLWPDSGVKIIENMGINHLLADGAGGGFLISTMDYAQRFNNSAQLLWPSPYVRMGISLRRMWALKNNADIEKNILVVGNSHDYKQIAAQKISVNAGKTQWPDSGRAWTPPDGQKIHPIITPNGKGGAFIFYKHLLQELDSEGHYVYKAPVSVLDTSLFEYSPYPVSGEFVEGQGAFILYVSSDSQGKEAQLVLQKITTDMALPWGDRGMQICDTTAFSHAGGSIIKTDPEVNEAFIFVEFTDGIFVTKVNLQDGDIATRVEQETGGVPSDYRISIFPNPFSGAARISWPDSKMDARTSVKIYDILGREVVDLTDQLKSNPTHIKWDGYDAFGRRAPAGVFFVRVKTARNVFQQKMVRIY